MKELFRMLTALAAVLGCLTVLSSLYIAERESRQADAWANECMRAREENAALRCTIVDLEMRSESAEPIAVEEE